MVARMQVVARVKQHWFYLLLPLSLVASLNFHLAHPWQQQPRLGEAIALFDWCLFVPALYALCYRRSQAPRAVALRTVALVCSGMWIASRMVPDGAQTLLLELGWVRWIGIAVVLVAEGFVLVAMLRIAFSPKPEAKALVDAGVPALLARMMVAEARFWRWLFAKLRR